jgi:hypothetical protein
MPETHPLSVAVADLAALPDDDPVFHAGTLASAATLTVGIVQRTCAVTDERTIRKHAARLRAALRGMAMVLREEEGDADPR